MIEDNFTSFEDMKRRGASVDEACAAANREGKSFFFQIRMLRAVYGLDLISARDTVGRLF